MLFQKDHVSVRYVKEEDASIISKWLTDPEVLQYYEGRDNPQSVEMVLAHFIHNPNSHEKDVIEFDNMPIGYIQMYPVDSEWKALYGYEESQMYGECINLSVSRLIGKKELGRNSFRQQLHILWRIREQKQSQWIQK